MLARCLPLLLAAAVASALPTVVHDAADKSLRVAGGDALSASDGSAGDTNSLQVDGEDELVASDGHPVRVDTVEAHESIFNMTRNPMAVLAKLKSVDVTLEPLNALTGGGLVLPTNTSYQAHLQISAVYRPVNADGIESDVELYLETPSGDVLYINSSSRTGTFTRKSGSNFNLVTSNRATGEGVHKMGFFSALMTSGSFTMMQAGSF